MIYPENAASETGGPATAAAAAAPAAAYRTSSAAVCADASCGAAAAARTHRSVERLPRTIELSDDARTATMIDQRALPQSLEYLRISAWQDMVACIKSLAVRGAPAIGIAGAYALALFSTNQFDAQLGTEAFLRELDEVSAHVACARPTAVNLAWAVERTRKAAHACADAGNRSFEAVRDALIAEARAIRDEDEACCRAIGAHGASLLGPQSRVLTHCNAGSLATAFYGTALGVIYAAHAQGKIARVYADETRPVGQGARLTAWELSQAGVPVTLQCDNMAAALMARGDIDAVIVGADRICANGDTANKIGTYGVAILAAQHGIPFYVAAPHSTIDASLVDGSQIPIEFRDASEVMPRALPGVDVFNPAFDVTPAHLISAIITERGVQSPPFAF